MTESDHRKCVDSWLEGRARDLTIAQYVALFDAGVSAVWRRASRTLGDVTLRAIMDRVLHTAADDHPMLSSVSLQADGVRVDRLRARARDVGDIEEALRCLLVELLTAIGHLTADILTPPLHEALRAARPRLPAAGPPPAPRPWISGSSRPPAGGVWRSVGRGSVPARITRIGSHRGASGT